MKPDEMKFCRQRFHIVNNQIKDPSILLDREDRLRLEREHRLLGHILYELEDGQVLFALESWRKRFGQELAVHLSETRSQQHAYDSWLRLSPEEKDRLLERPRPSQGVIIVDKNGYKWVIDQAYLRMMDDLIIRLKKWLSSE